MLDPAVLDALRYPLIALALLANVFSALTLATTWQSVPASVPAHYGITGRPDRWSGRWVLFLLLAVQTGVNVTLWLQRGDDLFFAWCLALVSILMAYVIWATIRIAQKQAERLHPLALYGMVALIAAPPLLRSLVTGK
jgi:hypothetical protein